MTLPRPLDRGLTLYLPLVLYGIFTLVPFYSMLSLAFHVGGQSTGEFSFLPIPFTLNHFKTLFSVDNFLPYVRNSLIVSAATVILDIPLAILTGYALCRYQFRGKLPFMLAVLTTQFVPASMLIIPIYIIFTKLHLLDSLIGLILINTTFELPFAAILTRGFISSIPFELEEAAMVDGCNRFQGVVRVVVPLLRPGMAAVAALTFVGAWNNFLFALFLLSDQNLYTIPVGLSYFLGEFNVDFSALAAGAVVAVLPVMVIFAFIQRYLASGLTVGAVKG